MAPEQNAGDGTPDFTVDERITLVSRGHNVMPHLRFDHPEDQIEAWCDIAREDAQLDGNLVRKSLDAAIVAAETMRDDSLDMPRHDGYYGPVTPFTSIARTAHAVGQEPEYVRSILDKATAQAEVHEWSPAPEVQRLQLSLLVDTASHTEQDPEYIRPLVDRMREVDIQITNGRPLEDTVDRRIEQLDRLVDLSRRVGLDEAYQRELFDEARSRWSISSEAIQAKIEAKAHELARIALVAKRLGQDPAYIRGILDEGRAVASWGAGAETAAHLAETAYVTGESETYIGDILVEGFHRVSEQQENQPPGKTLGSINTLLRGMHGPRTNLMDVLQAQFLHRGFSIIETQALPIWPRQKHMWLNRLLRDIELTPEQMTERNIERKPLSYVFKRTQTTEAIAA